ncbi:MAG: Holliday junction resolvase RuvX [Lachnospiraceae bacterium]|nr:Holliday junction resolvase RuvX [Lachnospiraceae bacterium]
MRLMGLDYGAKTVGVALSDALLLTSAPYETIFRTEENKLRKTFRRIEEIAKENDVGRIVLGLPLNMDDTHSEQTEKTLIFMEALKRRTGLPVELQDERLTSVAADEVLSESGVAEKDRKQYIDRIAAALILKEYMDLHQEELRN